MHAGSVAVICQSPKQTTSALDGADRAVFCGESGANHVATVTPLCLHTQRHRTKRAPQATHFSEAASSQSLANRAQAVQHNL